MAKPVKQWLSRWRQLPHAGWRSFSRWLHRHAGLIALILGPVIVLGTFVVKDVLRDQYKDSYDSLEAARITRMLKSSTNQIFTKLSILEEEFEAQTSENIDAKFRDNWMLTYNIQIMHREMVEISNDLESQNVLFKNLPQGYRSKHGLKNKDFINRYNSLQQRIHDLEVQAYRLIRGEITGVLNDLAQTAGYLGGEIGNLKIDIQDETSKLSSDFEDETKHAKRQLRNFSYLSQALYSAGIFIGILGQRAGGKGTGTAE